MFNFQLEILYLLSHAFWNRFTGYFPVHCSSVRACPGRDPVHLLVSVVSMGFLWGRSSKYALMKGESLYRKQNAAETTVNVTKEKCQPRCRISVSLLSEVRSQI